MGLLSRLLRFMSRVWNTTTWFTGFWKVVSPGFGEVLLWMGRVETPPSNAEVKIIDYLYHVIDLYIIWYINVLSWRPLLQQSERNQSTEQNSCDMLWLTVILWHLIPNWLLQLMTVTKLEVLWCAHTLAKIHIVFQAWIVSFAILMKNLI